MYTSVKMSVCNFVLIVSICVVKRFSAQNLRHQPPTDKLTLAEWPSYNIQNPHGPGTYAYGYEIDDPATKNVQFRDEEKLTNGTVQGSYGIVRTNGMVTLTRYTSGAEGYRAKTQTFNQGDIKPIILTTESPKISPMSSDIGYLDLNPEIVSKDGILQISDPKTIPERVAQQVLSEKQKLNLNPSNLHSPSNISETLLDRINIEDDNEEHQDQATGFSNENFQTLQSILRGQNPIEITTAKDVKNHTISVQFFNNYIPHNFQIVPFVIQKRFELTTSNEATNDVIFHDPVEDIENNKPFVNDKFHDPLYDFHDEIPQELTVTNIGKRKTNKIKNIRSTQKLDTKLKNYKFNNFKENRNDIKNNHYRIILSYN